MRPLAQLTDDALIALLKEHDRAAFAEIYERYKGPLYVHAFHRLGDREETKDLIQQLFTTLWDNRAQLQINVQLSGYLFTAVRNRVFKFLAHQQIESAYIDSIGKAWETGDCITDHLLRERELLEVIEREIAALPPKMREIFELSRKQYLTHKEIAEQLQISEKTVRNQVSNALHILRVKLGILGYLLFLLYR